jgi:hypothetical protein
MKLLDKYINKFPNRTPLKAIINDAKTPNPVL